MSDGDGAWPADPTDPRCPHCGGPVSATADYCLHCHEDLPSATEPTGGAAPGEADAGAARDAATGASGPSPAGESTAAAREDGSTRGLLHPDGLLDDALTVVVGLAAGVAAGILAAATVVFALPGGGPFLVGAVAWVGTTVAATRSRSVRGAVRTGGYLLALLLVALPVVLASTAPMSEPGSGERLGVAVVLAVFAWPVAAVLAGVGWWLGGRPADGDDG